VLFRLLARTTRLVDSYGHEQPARCGLVDSEKFVEIAAVTAAPQKYWERIGDVVRSFSIVSVRITASPLKCIFNVSIHAAENLTGYREALFPYKRTGNHRHPGYFRLCSRGKYY